MEESLSVHIGKRLKCLIRNVSNFDMWQSTLFLLQLIDIAIEILEYEVELIIFFDELEQLDYVGMVEFGEDANFVQSHTLVPVLVLTLHALDGHDLSRLLVESLRHATETTVSELVAHFILLHSNYIQPSIRFIHT